MGTRPGRLAPRKERDDDRRWMTPTHTYPLCLQLSLLLTSVYFHRFLSVLVAVKPIDPPSQTVRLPATQDERGTSVAPQRSIHTWRPACLQIRMLLVSVILKCFPAAVEKKKHRHARFNRSLIRRLDHLSTLEASTARLVALRIEPVLVRGSGEPVRRL